MVIFISYSSKNRTLVDQLADHLSEMGYTVLYDQKILAGKAWWDKILEDIRDCTVFIYALSPEYTDSYPCDLEYRYARELNRPMLPVMIQPVDFKQVPSHIALTNVLNYTSLDSRESLMKLVRTLNELSRQPSPVLPDPLPTPPPAPISVLNSVIDKITDFSISLTKSEQETLLTDIRGFLYKRETRRNARYALERFRKRSELDLAASVADEIDSLLELSAGDATPPPLSRTTRPTLQIKPGWIVAAVALLLALGGGGLIIRQLGQQGGITPTPATPTTIAQQSTMTSAPTSPPPTATLKATSTNPPTAKPSTPTPIPPTPTRLPPTTTFTKTPVPPTATPVPTATATVSSLVTANNQWKPQFQTVAGVEMAQVPRGCFMMGSTDGNSEEKPVTKICFEKDFWIDKTEVTQAQFIQFGGQAARSSYFKGDNRPVEQITWIEAREFCAKRAARLPTEAEWEYAARGPDNLIYPWGNTFDGGKVIYNGTSSEGTATVGSIPSGASWVGVVDMSGNVWEWVSTIYKPYPYDAGDGREDNSDTNSVRVLRGSSWFDHNSFFLRVASRNGFTPSYSNYYFGFRCARS